MPFPLRKGYYLFSRYIPAYKLLPDRIEIVEIHGGIGKGMKMNLNLRHERDYFFGIHESKVQ